MQKFTMQDSAAKAIDMLRKLTKAKGTYYVDFRFKMATECVSTIEYTVKGYVVPDDEETGEDK